jgi:hypothetical protein
MGDLQRRQLLTQLFEVRFRRREETRVLAAHFQIMLFEQPPRIAAKFPFRATIWTGPQNHPQTFLLRKPHELRDVRVAGEMELTFARFVLVPENVDGNRVQSHRVHHLQAIGPVLVRNPARMHFASLDLKRFPVEQKIRVADGEGGSGVDSRQAARQHEPTSRAQTKQPDIGL